MCWLLPRLQGFTGPPGKSGAVGSLGPPGAPGPDGIGPPKPKSMMKTGNWPSGNCFTKAATCTQLGVTDNLCGDCKPLCDRCDADAGFKLINPFGLRFGDATFDQTKLDKGSVQVQNICLLARYGNKGAIDKSQPLPSANSYGVFSTDKAQMQVNPHPIPSPQAQQIRPHYLRFKVPFSKTSVRVHVT